jgi:hypothetical protein
MDIVRGANTAGVLPEATALIPVKAQTPKGIGGGAVSTGGKIQPNPTANDFNQFVLGRQLGFEQVQDRLRGQLTVGRCAAKARVFETDDGRTFAGADASFLKFVVFIAFF